MASPFNKILFNTFNASPPVNYRESILRFFIQNTQGTQAKTGYLKNCPFFIGMVDRFRIKQTIFLTLEAFDIISPFLFLCIGEIIRFFEQIEYKQSKARREQ